MAFLKWAGTQTGRSLLQGIAFAGATGVFAAYHLPQSLFIDKYQEFVQSYTRGFETPVAPKVKMLYDQVLSDLKIGKVESSFMSTFTVYGFDMFHAGCSKWKSGAIVGIPVNLSYEKESDVDRNIKVIESPIDWESEGGKQLRSSLVFSDDAKKFAIAREILDSRSHLIWTKSVFPGGAVLCTYMVSKSLNDKFNTRQHPLRFILYALVGTFFYTLYLTLTDMTTAFRETSTDEEVALIGPQYTNGGIEYYSKLLERNKAMRKLLGEAGEKLFTVSGNEVLFLRMKNTPLVDRLRNLQEIKANSKDTEIEQ